MDCHIVSHISIVLTKVHNIIFLSEKCYPFGFFCDAVKKNCYSDKILNHFFKKFQHNYQASWFNFYHQNFSDTVLGMKL